MASITASIRRLVLPAARQTCCRAATNICAPRLFSILGPSQAELGTGSQESVQVPATQGGPQVQAMGRDGDQDHIEKDWEFDDFTSKGHSELERHREARQYARITAYEMPRLSGMPNLQIY